jgi:sigma-B regulation protein RsbU (phosphoserine phosphatase)
MDLFVTVFYGILDPRDGRFRYANGGHNPPLLWRRDEDEPVPLASTGGLLLGMMKDLHYAEGEVALAASDLLLLYTDGVTEAQNAAGEEFSEQRLIRAVAAAGDDDPEAIVAQVTARLREFTRDVPLADDLTCLVLRYAGPSRSG